MLFRIDTSSGFDDKIRQYGFPESAHVILKGEDIERFIAEETAKEINGRNERRLISYSKSLGVCILKYNNYLDNKLHFAEISSHMCAGYTEIYYYFRKQIHCTSYFLQYGLRVPPFDEAELVNFIIDVSDNNIVQAYFQKHLERGKNPFASPAKDQEVVAMRPLVERVIDAENLEAVYILYALSIKYDFLSSNHILKRLIDDVYNTFLEGRFTQDEILAFICLIQYLAYYGNYERNLSQAIRDRNSISERIPFYYDLICEYDAIINSSFTEAYEMSYSSENVITSALWRWCSKFLGIML